jgi:hypothetical protein
VLILRRVVAILILLLIAIPSLLAPVYRFPPPQPFTGASLWNPYARLTGTWQKVNLHAHGKPGAASPTASRPTRVVRAYKQHGYAVAGVSNTRRSPRSMASTRFRSRARLQHPQDPPAGIGARRSSGSTSFGSARPKQFIINRVGAAADWGRSTIPTPGTSTRTCAS